MRPGRDGRHREHREANCWRGREKQTESDNRLDEVAVVWPKHACGKGRARAAERAGL